MTTPQWVVTQVTPKKDYTLELTFADGEKRFFDVKPMLGKPICEKLNNPEFFMRAKADCGTVVWDDEVDIAPEYLYEFSTPVSHTV